MYFKQVRPNCESNNCEGQPHTVLAHTCLCESCECRKNLQFSINRYSQLPYSGKLLARFLVWWFGELIKDCQIKNSPIKLYAYMPMTLGIQITKFKFCQYQLRAILSNLMLTKILSNLMLTKITPAIQLSYSSITLFSVMIVTSVHSVQFSA